MKNVKPRLRSICLLYLLIVIASTSVGVIAGYEPPSGSVPLEVKEPLQILSSPFGLSLFPGETVWFNVTVENMASVNYSAILGFSLNETQYQTQFATFSNEEYNVVPGTQTLTAWLTVAPEAPPGNFLITVNVTRQGEGVPTSQDSPLPSPKTSLTPSLELLGNGARWAAGNGTSALVINWKDNYLAHNQTDGADWGPWPEKATMNNWSQSIQQTLENTGFTVKSAGDLPENLSGYDLVVIHAYWAVEPRHTQLIRDYVSNGGSIVILAGVPCYLNVYSKDWWPGNSMLPEWLGGGFYVNAGGNVTVTVNNPFGTKFSAGDSILYANTSSCAAVSSPTNNGQIIARWSSGLVFAFTNEYGQGRVYYQATF
jgi:hypothetical protein